MAFPLCLLPSALSLVHLEMPGLCSHGAFLKCHLLPVLHTQPLLETQTGQQTLFSHPQGLLTRNYSALALILI